MDRAKLYFLGALLGIASRFPSEGLASGVFNNGSSEAMFLEQFLSDANICTRPFME
jgi:hypothetical protein